MDRDFVIRQELDSLNADYEKGLGEMLSKYRFPPAETRTTNSSNSSNLGAIRDSLSQLQNSVIAMLKPNTQNKLVISDDLIKYCCMVLLVLVVLWMFWKSQKSTRSNPLQERMLELEEDIDFLMKRKK